MAKLIVEIEMPDEIAEGIQKDLSLVAAGGQSDWFPKPGHISIDNAYLEQDDRDDSFYAFKLLEIRREGTTSVAEDLVYALNELQVWCINNVPYYPDIPELQQNSGEADQPPEDLIDHIDKQANDALARYRYGKDA